MHKFATPEAKAEHERWEAFYAALRQHPDSSVTAVMRAAGIAASKWYRANIADLATDEYVRMIHAAMEAERK